MDIHEKDMRLLF